MKPVCSIIASLKTLQLNVFWAGKQKVQIFRPIKQEITGRLNINGRSSSGKIKDKTIMM